MRSFPIRFATILGKYNARNGHGTLCYPVLVHFGTDLSGVDLLHQDLIVRSESSIVILMKTVHLHSLTVGIQNKESVIVHIAAEELVLDHRILRCRTACDVRGDLVLLSIFDCITYQLTSLLIREMDTEFEIRIGVSLGISGIIQHDARRHCPRGIGKIDDLVFGNASRTVGSVITNGGCGTAVCIGQFRCADVMYRQPVAVGQRSSPHKAGIVHETHLACDVI